MCSTSSDGSTLFDSENFHGIADFDDDAILEKASVAPEEMKNPCVGKFIDFRQGMREINDKLFKYTIQQGSELVDLENQRVTFEYASFREGDADPFDSSFKLKRPAVYSYNDEIEQLLGYCLALATMKLGEEAVFWISSEYIFGVHGL